MKKFSEVIEFVRREQVTLFIGSGFSLKAGAPTASHISEEIKSNMTDKEKETLIGDQLDYVAEEFQEMHDRKKLIEIVKNVLGFKQKDISDHIKLKSIPHFRNIITTNYDSLLEDIYGQSDAYVVRCADDCIDLPNDKTIIYKIHGDMVDTNHLVLTKSDYTQYFTKKNNNILLWNIIESRLITDKVLFIGYSLEDNNIFSIIEHIQQNSKYQKGTKYFLIAPNMQKHKIRRLKEFGVKYYDAYADEFLDELLKSLEKHIKKDYEKKRVTSSTFTKFCYAHNLQPVITEKEECNEIRKFETNGTVQTQINIQTPTNILADINKPNFFNQKVPFLPCNTPVRRIGIDEVKSMTIVVNGLVLGEKEDFKEIYIAPRQTPIEGHFQVKDSSSIFSLKGTKYKNGDALVLEFMCDIYSLSLLFAPNGLSCTVKLTPEYHSKREAVRLMDLAISIMSGQEIELTLINEPIEPLIIKIATTDEQTIKDFNEIQNYYRAVIKIEELYNVDLPCYENYSQDNFHIASLLIHSYNEKFFKDNLDRAYINVNIDTPMKKKCLQSNGLDSEKHIMYLESVPANIRFCGYDFGVIYQHLIYEDCEIESVDINKNTATLRVISDHLTVAYSSKTADKLKPLDEEFRRNN